ncbi:hypothetical protein CSUI_007659 [Cystoisospora suis]|uniref:Uncharacterized protein n=1 Tax=Cystoisospora suis TaxID=483139 RepID=A0A2C6KPT1_9APIC|nr:hypothetical protein CSUI_007659 [Cystoisospora suis]
MRTLCGCPLMPRCVQKGASRRLVGTPVLGKNKTEAVEMGGVSWGLLGVGVIELLAFFVLKPSGGLALAELARSRQVQASVVEVTARPHGISQGGGSEHSTHELTEAQNDNAEISFFLSESEESPLLPAIVPERGGSSGRPAPLVGKIEMDVPVEELTGRSDVFEKTVVKRKKHAKPKGIGARVLRWFRKVGKRVFKTFRKGRAYWENMSSLWKLQLADRKPLQPIGAHITKQRLWYLVNESWPVSPSEALSVSSLRPGLKYSVPVTSCGQYRQASLAHRARLFEGVPADESSTRASSDAGSSWEKMPLSPQAQADEEAYRQAKDSFERNVRDPSEDIELDSSYHAGQEGTSRAPLRVALLQWNTELFKPTALELITPFCRQSPGEQRGKPMVNVDNVDIFFVTTQENNRLPPGDERTLIGSVRNALNALSSNPNWLYADLIQLNNETGTLFRKMRMFTPNTQMILWVARKSVLFESTPQFCMSSINGTEKGFVAVKMDIQGIGNILVAGTHILFKSTRRQEATRKTLEALATTCTGFSLGPEEDSSVSGLLNDFTHIILVGDFNARFTATPPRSLFHALSGQLPPSVMHESDAVRELWLMQSLVNAYRRPPTEFERLLPVLFEMDTGVNHQELVGTGQDIATPLIEAGFSSISVCYPGGFSYKWNKQCVPCLPGTCDTVTVADIMDRCYSPLSMANFKESGFLDRAVIRSRGGHQAFISSSYILHNLRSDHPPYVFTFDMYGSIPQKER